MIVDAVFEFGNVQSLPHKADESWEDFLRQRWHDGALEYV